VLCLIHTDEFRRVAVGGVNWALERVKLQDAPKLAALPFNFACNSRMCS